jgi:hypothetical protein
MTDYITQIWLLTLSFAWNILAPEIHDISETESILSSGERGGRPIRNCEARSPFTHTPTVSYIDLMTEAELVAETLWLFKSLNRDFFPNHILKTVNFSRRSLQPSCLRHALSSLVRKPGPWVRIPLRAWMFGVWVCMCVCVCVPFFVFVLCDELITRPRSPTECLRSSKPKWYGEFHRGRPRPKLGL